ncbi:hypothetical protein Tco_0259949 [Tanacetum coccineum]
MNDMADLDEGSDSENWEEDVRVEECLDDGSSKSECNSNENREVNDRKEKDKRDTEIGRNENEVKNNHRTYAKMVTKDMKIVNNKLAFVPTIINEEGSEFVIFDETLVEKCSAQ